MRALRRHERDRDDDSEKDRHHDVADNWTWRRLADGLRWRHRLLRERGGGGSERRRERGERACKAHRRRIREGSRRVAMFAPMFEGRFHETRAINSLPRAVADRRSGHGTSRVAPATRNAHAEYSRITHQSPGHRSKRYECGVSSTRPSCSVARANA